MILLYWSTVEIVEVRTGGIARENTIAIISSDTLVLVDSREVEVRTGGIARENNIAIISSDTLVLVDSRDSRGEDRGYS